MSQRPFNRILSIGILSSVALLALTGQYSAAAGQKAKPDRITKKDRHELVMLPYYGVFDNISYRVDRSTVTLFGQVTRPTLNSDAEKAEKSIDGDEGVI